MVLDTLPIEFEHGLTTNLIKRHHPNAIQTRWEHQWDHRRDTCLPINTPRCLPLNIWHQEGAESEDEHDECPVAYHIWLPDWEQDWIA